MISVLVRSLHGAWESSCVEGYVNWIETASGTAIVVGHMDRLAEATQLQRRERIAAENTAPLYDDDAHASRQS